MVYVCRGEGGVVQASRCLVVCIVIDVFVGGVVEVELIGEIPHWMRRRER